MYVCIYKRNGVRLIYLVGCAYLAAPANGSVAYPSGTKYRSVAVFSCRPGFTLVGVVERTCMEDKSWNGTSPICQINSMELTNIFHSFIYIATVYYKLAVGSYKISDSVTLVWQFSDACLKHSGTEMFRNGNGIPLLTSSLLLTPIVII